MDNWRTVGFMNFRREYLVIFLILVTEVLGFSLILPFLPLYAQDLGTGDRGIRVIPSYIVGSEEIHEFLKVLDSALYMQEKRKVKHTGNICRYLNCGEVHS